MATSPTVEERLAALEREVADLKKQGNSGNHKHWLESFVGIFEHEPGFDDVIRYGREFRQSDRPDDLGKEAS